MKFVSTPIKDLWLIELIKIQDERGLFARTFCKKEFDKIAFDKDFVQFNHSLNKKKGTLRGMHFQKPPYAETKLIRCVQGSVYDVAIDLRKNSPTFLNHFGIELSEENMLSVLIPEGFAHGFQTLTDNASLIYHHTEYYQPDSDGGIQFNDPMIGINWPLSPLNVSEKDKSYLYIENNFKGIEL